MDLNSTSSEILATNSERQDSINCIIYKPNQEHFSVNCNLGSVVADIQLKPLASHGELPPKPTPFLFRENPKLVKSEDVIAEDDLVERVFATGSKYVGEWKNHDMDGMCAYVFPNGAVFEGKFYLGVFDGLCTIQYPHGGCFQGFWFEGTLERWKYVFKDGLVYSSDEDWEYLKQPDRRFWTEIRRGLKPGGAEQLSDVELARELPDGLYDVGYGLYNPKDLTVIHPDTNEFIRVPSAKEIEWIIKNCRKGGKIKIGFQKDLYKDWFGDEDGHEEICISDISGVKWTRPALDNHKTRFRKLFKRNKQEAKRGFKYRSDIFDEEVEVKRDVQSMAREKRTAGKDTDLTVVGRAWNKIIGGEILMSDLESFDENLFSTKKDTTLPIELSSRHVSCTKLAPSIDSLFVGSYEAKKTIRWPRFKR